ncbi:MAG: PPC domain-containing DNA-binding protein [bacterium]|nr:PPC domain-containing DNA-binding protein [bacterium]
MLRHVQPTSVYMGRLPYGADLLEALHQVCIEKEITLGRIEAIGAVQKAAVMYYNQDKQKYETLQFDRHLEIISLMGNVSVKDSQPMVHGHISLADQKGNAFGGHLATGTIIFACEVTIQVFEGTLFEREQEPQTGLPLWKEPV